MKIAAVCTAYHEADILPYTVAHLLAEGVDWVSVELPSSDDETMASLAAIGWGSGAPVTVVPVDEEVHEQPRWIDELARRSADVLGPDDLWIVPFDADEFWTARRHSSLWEALASTPMSVSKVYARMWRYWDLDYRDAMSQPWPKVAYRWSRSAHIRAGNHDVEGVPGDSDWTSTLEVREVQYRSFEHFCRKIVERNRTIDPTLPPDHGAHHRRLAGLSIEELRTEWERMRRGPLVLEPIRSRASLSPSTVPAAS